jgi:hypothetical protein
MTVGEYRTAGEHAAVAWPILARLHADDDARSMRISTAIWPMVEGDLETAGRIIDAVADDGMETKLGSQMVLLAARAELALAGGDVDTGLRLYDEALDSVRPVEGLDLGGISPWVLIAASGSLVARVRHGRTDADEARARELVGVLVEQEYGARVDNELPYQDFPLNGVLLAALGVWALRWGTREQHDPGVRLLVIADRWAYNRSLPTMAWEPLRDLAERTCPGLLDEVSAEYADRPPADFLEEARVLLGRVTSFG